MDDQLPGLGELELEVMQIVWNTGEVTAEQVRDRLARNPKESTVRTILKRLEDKGFVTHSVARRTFVFRAAQARQEVAARAVKRVVDWFCNGSVDDVLVGMADARMLEPRMLKLLARRIAAAKARR